MLYTVSAVDQEREGDRYDTKYGKNINYRVKFKETEDTVVQVSQKESTPAPKVGQQFEGEIDMSGQYGPKFKKTFTQGSAPATKASSKAIDPHTMYVSYAKDVAVALIATMGDPTKEEFERQFNAALEHIRRGATVLEMLSGGSEGIKAPEDF